MSRNITLFIVAVAILLEQADGAWAQRSRGSVSHAPGSTSAQGRYGGSASRNVSQTSSGYDVNKQVTTQGGYSKDVNRDINTQDQSINRSSTATNPWGQSASRDRTVQNEGGYASVSGSASTSTGRSASGQGVAGVNAYGQPAYAGTVNTKYNGSYATAGARNPYGGWTTATAGPYGGKVTTTLPSGYRTSTYYGRPYYSYGGAYYRPYTYAGAHYYYPVPAPYYAYYEAPPVGAMMLAVAGTTYLLTKEGNYAKQTTTSSGSVAYQSVPAPVGASLHTLPAQRVLVTVGGTTYFLYANTFYRRVVDGAQESFVVVTPPAGVVLVSALPADFTVEQFNAMYFAAQGQFYVPFLSSDGKELYVMVDRPPQPPAGAGTPAGATPATMPAGGAVTPASPPAGPSPAAGAAPATAPPAPAVRAVDESLTVPAGTLLVTRLAASVSATTASSGDRLRGYLDHDLAAGGRLIAASGARVYGIVTAVDRKHGAVTVALTDITVGDQVVPIITQPVSGQGGVIPAQSPVPFTVSAPFHVDILTNVAVR